MAHHRRGAPKRPAPRMESTCGAPTWCPPLPNLDVAHGLVAPRLLNSSDVKCQGVAPRLHQNGAPWLALFPTSVKAVVEHICLNESPISTFT
jgi:hypothetical protein